MEPVRQGDRGPAVEDVQRRLLALGYELGPSGVDGVFLGATLAAVRSFQKSMSLEEDGAVGPITWSALVDATFKLGDRLLYLRVPYFHGCDVRDLQGALNALGFSCGEPDGIFGPFTERAVREFQANTGQPSDGIAGPETVRALMNLRHVWADKDPRAPVGLRAAPARAATALRLTKTGMTWGSAVTEDVARRLANLMLASEPGCEPLTLDPADRVPSGVRLVVRLVPCAGTDPSVPTVVGSSDPAALPGRLLTALAATTETPARIDVVIDESDAADERSRQRAAVGLLDALCAALAQELPTVVS